jgi:hypothetical protein
MINPGRGDSFLFWSDKWLLNGSHLPLKERFPCLFSYLLNENLSNPAIFDMEDMAELFYQPLSVRAYQEFSELQHLIQEYPLSDHNDVWVYS